MPVPPYTIHFHPSSSGTVLASQHPSSAHSRMSGVHVGSYDLVLSTYQSLGGLDRISSQKGITNTLCLDGTSIPGLHLTKTLHPRTSSSHMYPPQVPLVGDAQVAPPPGKTRPTTPRKILPDRLNPQHTPKTHAQDLPGCYHIIGTKCLNPSQTTHHQASHHRYNA